MQIKNLHPDLIRVLEKFPPNLSDKEKYEHLIQYLNHQYELSNSFSLSSIRAEASKTKLKELYHIVVEISSQLMQSSESSINKDINEALAILGQFIDVDRVYIFDIDEENQLLSNTFEWCKEGVSPEINNLQKIPFSVAKRWKENFYNNLPVYIPNVDDIPKENYDEKEILKAQGITSLLTVPVFYGKDLIAFGGYDSVGSEMHWSDEYIALLKVAMNIIVSNIFRLKHEVKINSSLKEKELLLKEIHHRIKNNLSLIDGIIELKKLEIQNPDFKHVLTDTQSRIHSVGLIHTQLYQSVNFSKVDLSNYIEEIIEHFRSFYQDQIYPIHVNISSEQVLLNTDKAIPFGIMLSELLNNALKYGKNKSGQLTINISLKKQDQTIDFKFSDQGEGFKMDENLDHAKSFGLRLIKNMLTQLEAHCSYHQDEGAHYHIKIPVE